MLSVTRGGPGLVAVGWDGGSEAQPWWEGAVWTSPDGLSWSRVPRDRDVFSSQFEAGEPEMIRVASGEAGRRLVAVGVDHSLGQRSAAAVWFSLDGLFWTRVPHDDTIFGGLSSYFQMDDVVAGGPGFVAAGVEAFPEGEFRRLPHTDGVLINPVFWQDVPVCAAIWTSNDRLAWERVPAEQLPAATDENVRLIGVETGGPGLVAVGWRGQPEDRDTVVWASADGETWSLASDLGGALRGPGSQVLLDVVAGGPGLVAVGADGGAGGSSAGVWTSPGRPAAGSTAVAPVEASAAPASFDLQETLDSFVGSVPGGVVALSVRNVATTTAATGVANAAGELLRPDTPFRVPDTFTTAMVLQLVDEGLVDLDEPLSSYLPDVVLGGDIPVRLLLTRRDGLPSFSGDQRFLRAIPADPSYSFTQDELLGFIAETPRVSPDAQDMNDDFTPSVLLRQLIERLDGTDIRTSLRTRIVEPLGLEATIFPGNGTPLPEGTTAGWDNFPLVLNGDPTSAMEAVDGSGRVAVTTANELRIYLDALFAGELISPERVAEMTTMDADGRGMGIFAASLGPSRPAFGSDALEPGVERPGFGNGEIVLGGLRLYAIEPSTGDILILLTNFRAPEARFRLDGLAGQVFRGWAEEESGAS